MEEAFTLFSFSSRSDWAMVAGAITSQSDGANGKLELKWLRTESTFKVQEAALPLPPPPQCGAPPPPSPLPRGLPDGSIGREDTNRTIGHPLGREGHRREYFASRDGMAVVTACHISPSVDSAASVM